MPRHQKFMPFLQRQNMSLTTKGNSAFENISDSFRDIGSSIPDLIFSPLFYFLLWLNPQTRSITLAKATTIDKDWLEIKLRKPLKLNGKWQWIALALDDSHIPTKSEKGIGIPLSDGSFAHSETRVVDKKGNSIFLSSGSRHNESLVFRLPSETFSKNTEIKKILVRSDKPIKCEAIYFTCQYWMK